MRGMIKKTVSIHLLKCLELKSLTKENCFYKNKLQKEKKTCDSL